MRLTGTAVECSNSGLALATADPGTRPTNNKLIPDECREQSGLATQNATQQLGTQRRGSLSLSQRPIPKRN